MVDKTSDSSVESAEKNSTECERKFTLYVAKEMENFQIHDKLLSKWKKLIIIPTVTITTVVLFFLVTGHFGNETGVVACNESSDLCASEGKKSFSNNATQTQLRQLMREITRNRDGLGELHEKTQAHHYVWAVDVSNTVYYSATDAEYWGKQRCTGDYMYSRATVDVSFGLISGQIVVDGHKCGGDVFVAIKGTDSLSDVVSNADLEPVWVWLTNQNVEGGGSWLQVHGGFAKMAGEIMSAWGSQIQDYLAHSSTDFFTFTGHSLGGAVCNLLALNYGTGCIGFGSPGQVLYYDAWAIPEVLTVPPVSLAPRINIWNEEDPIAGAICVNIQGGPICSQSYQHPSVTSVEMTGSGGKFKIRNLDETWGKTKPLVIQLDNTMHEIAGYKSKIFWAYSLT